MSMTQRQQQVDEIQRLASELRADKDEVAEARRRLHQLEEQAAKTELLYRRQNLWREVELARDRAASLERRLNQFNELLNQQRSAQARLASIKALGS
jgi:hypothetical protein